MFNKALAMDGPLPPDLPKWMDEFLTQYHDSYTLDQVFASPVFPLQRRLETLAMLDAVRDRPHQTIMEIGADKGGSLLAWLMLKPQRLIVSEWRGTPYSSVMEPKFPDTRFCWIESSYDPRNLHAVDDFLQGGFIDVLFIDGDKAAFTKDFDNYLLFMNPNKGTVIMHDITDDSPGRSFTDIKRRGYRTEEIVLKEDAIAAMQREAKGIPCANSYEQWLRQWKGQSCGVGIIYLD